MTCSSDFSEAQIAAIDDWIDRYGFSAATLFSVCFWSGVFQLAALLTGNS